ncbi:MAG TPA: hypothetical protein VH877_32730 [Polyangia bacterium]|jgi:hypothetical protein|nr:hypothetical protein [Polyangia bacterium]
MLKRIARILAAGLLGLGVVLLVLIALHQATHGRTHPITDEGGRPVPGSIASLERVRLGGVEQTIHRRGRNAASPVLLFLHGGPGMPAMFLAHRFQHDPEEPQRFAVEMERVRREAAGR